MSAAIQVNTSSTEITQTGRAIQPEQILAAPPIQQKITEVTQGLLPNNSLPVQGKKEEGLTVRVLYDSHAVLYTTYFFLMAGYDKDDPIDNWVFQLLEASANGEIEKLKNFLGFLEYAYPDNQHAILFAAYFLAEKKGQGEVVQLLFGHNNPAASENFSLKFDRSKESSNLVRALSKNENMADAITGILIGIGAATASFTGYFYDSIPLPGRIVGFAVTSLSFLFSMRDMAMKKDQITYDVIRFQLKQNKVEDACHEFNSLQTAGIKNLAYNVLKEKFPDPNFFDQLLNKDSQNRYLYPDLQRGFPLLSKLFI